MASDKVDDSDSDSDAEPFGPVACYACRRPLSVTRAKFAAAKRRCTRPARIAHDRWEAMPLNQRAFEAAGIRCTLCRSALVATSPDDAPPARAPGDSAPVYFTLAQRAPNPPSQPGVISKNAIRAV
jgi:hypothetical protein